jgi:hypothetical protein
MGGNCNDDTVMVFWVPVALYTQVAGMNASGAITGVCYDLFATTIIWMCEIRLETSPLS